MPAGGVRRRGGARCWSAEPFDLVVLDIQMPGDGRDAAARRAPAALARDGRGDGDRRLGRPHRGGVPHPRRAGLRRQAVRDRRGAGARAAGAREAPPASARTASYQLHLEERVQEQADRIEELFVLGVQSLVQALEAKDQYTRGHSARVAVYAVEIARQLGVDDGHARGDPARRRAARHRQDRGAGGGAAASRPAHRGGVPPRHGAPGHRRADPGAAAPGPPASCCRSCGRTTSGSTAPASPTTCRATPSRSWPGSRAWRTRSTPSRPAAPYMRPRPPEEAVAELRRCTGLAVRPRVRRGVRAAPTPTSRSFPIATPRRGRAARRGVRRAGVTPLTSPDAFGLRRPGHRRRGPDPGRRDAATPRRSGRSCAARGGRRVGLARDSAPSGPALVRRGGRGARRGGRGRRGAGDGPHPDRPARGRGRWRPGRRHRRHRQPQSDRVERAQVRGAGRPLPHQGGRRGAVRAGRRGRAGAGGPRAGLAARATTPPCGATSSGCSACRGSTWRPSARGAFRVALDCVRGAGATVMPALLEALGCEVQAINLEPDGALPARAGADPRAPRASWARSCGRAGPTSGSRSTRTWTAWRSWTRPGRPIGEDYTLAFAVRAVLPHLPRAGGDEPLDQPGGGRRRARASACTVERAPVGEANVVERMRGPRRGDRRGGERRA